MAELSTSQKEQIVLMLARFKTPAEIVACFRTGYELDISIQQVVKYDPTRPAYEARDHWRVLFEATRGQYLTEVAKVPIAHQAYRLNVLQEALFAARQTKNWKLVADLLEQAAKEVGGSLTNQSKFEMTDGLSVRHLSAADRASLLGTIISEALERRSSSVVADNQRTTPSLKSVA